MKKRVQHSNRRIRKHGILDLLLGALQPPDQLLHRALADVRASAAQRAKGVAVYHERLHRLDRFGARRPVSPRQERLLTDDLLGAVEADAAFHSACPLHQSDPARAAEVLSSALSLWTGPPFTVDGEAVSPTSASQFELIRLDLEERFRQTAGGRDPFRLLLCRESRLLHL